MKICSKCEEEKPLDEFRKDKYNKFGRTTRCKACLRTYVPEDIRCYYCQEWFTRKQSNWKFCTRKCHRRYWSRVWRLGVKGTIHMIGYQRQYSRSNGEECAECGGIVSNGSKRCQKCHCKYMSKLAWQIN